MTDREMDIVHAYPPPLPTSPRGHEMALAFRLSFNEHPHERPRTALATTRKLVLPQPGQILFVTGASGSGKSSLLRLLARRARRRKRHSVCILNLRSMRLADRCVLDLFDDAELASTLRRLSAVGLAEAWTWLRRPRELSEGQRWRLRLALALERAEREKGQILLVCDEFCALLDRVSAQIVAMCARRAVDQHASSLAALLATSHEDLESAIDADLSLYCDFGEHRLVQRVRHENRKRGAR